MVSSLNKVRASRGELPPDHRSHDHLNEQKEVPVRPGVIEKWAEEFRRIGEEREKVGEKVIWVLLDGFILYWNQVRSCCRNHKSATPNVPQRK
jgi:nicotinamide/nicotinate riboside kinase